jgi:hypothetical protein
MSDAINIPTPVQPLGYAQEREDAWLKIIRAVAMAAIVVSAGMIFNSVSMLVSAFSGGPVRWRLPAMVSLEGLYVAVELARNVAAALLLVGATGAMSLRPWSRRFMFWGALGVSVAIAFDWGWGILQMFTIRGYAGRTIHLVMAAARGLGFLVMQIVMPVFILWLMRRAEVRQRFAGQVGS